MKKWNLEFNRNTVLGRTFLKLGCFFVFVLFLTDFPGSGHQSYSVFDFVFLHLLHQNVMSIFFFFLCLSGKFYILSMLFVYRYVWKICS